MLHSLTIMGSSTLVLALSTPTYKLRGSRHGRNFPHILPFSANRVHHVILSAANGANAPRL